MLCPQNRVVNAHCSNVEWRQADATTLRLQPGSLDVVFSNWLLMYLSDEEVGNMAAESLRWVSIAAIEIRTCFQGAHVSVRP